MTDRRQLVAELIHLMNQFAMWLQLEQPKPVKQAGEHFLRLFSKAIQLTEKQQSVRKLGFWQNVKTIWVAIKTGAAHRYFFRIMLRYDGELIDRAEGQIILFRMMNIVENLKQP